MQAGSDHHSRLRQFIDHEATGGLLIAAAAAVAILLVNTGFDDEYHRFLDQRAVIGIGALTLDKSLHHLINDGLMAVFFFLVGLEIKREVVEGHLSMLSQVTLPLAAAIGGIAAPALIYVLFNQGDATAMRGWAIPTATDIAFALGALALAGRRATLPLKIFLLTLATFDDLAAIVIIALFYATTLSALALTGAGVCLAALVAMNVTRVSNAGFYLLVGVVLWLFVLNSGVHATLAGVALGLLIPLNRRDGAPLLHTIEEALHPYVKFLILPLFGFANAGLPLAGFSIDGLLQGVPLGIIAGLALGKPIGILLVCVMLVQLGLARLPEDSNWRDIAGVACLAGIGFTMSLFIGSLAFDDAMQDQVRGGVMVGSLISVAAGLGLLMGRR
jgi:Na+:H+ antiporter, NhaA family